MITWERAERLPWMVLVTGKYICAQSYHTGIVESGVASGQTEDPDYTATQT
jgi:hypothetical protein